MQEKTSNVAAGCFGRHCPSNKFPFFVYLFFYVFMPISSTLIWIFFFFFGSFGLCLKKIVSMHKFCNKKKSYILFYVIGI